VYNVDDVTEHAPPQDVFVTGLAGIEDAGGGNLRFTFYTLKRSRMYADRRTEKVLASVSIVMPADLAGVAAQATILAAEGIEGIIHGIPVERKNGDLN
jgi:hypothetical protein